MVELRADLTRRRTASTVLSMSLLVELRRLLVSLIALVLLATGCSSSGSQVAEPPEFAEPAPNTPAEVATTPAVEPVPQPTEEAPPEVEAPEPTAMPADPDGVDPDAEDEPDGPVGMPDVDDVEAVQALFPDPSESPFQRVEIGYSPSATGEIPIIDFNNGQSDIVLNTDLLVMSLCINSEQNVRGTYISTTSGVRCGFELRPFTGDPEQTCRALFPDNEIVELDPQLRVTAQPGSDEQFDILTIGCAIPVTQEGLDAHFQAET